MAHNHLSGFKKFLIDELLFCTIGNINNAFKINKDLGDITVNQKLDREITPEYLLTVVATDHGIPAQRSTTQVKV